MSLKSQFGTDQKAESAGVEIEYAPNTDGTVPTFTLARMCKSNKKYTKALDKATRPYQRAIAMGTITDELSEKIRLDVFVKSVLLSWRDVEYEEGEKLPFTKENAEKLMTDLPDLYADLEEKASSAAMFRIEELETSAKN